MTLKPLSTSPMTSSSATKRSSMKSSLLSTELRPILGIERIVTRSRSMGAKKGQAVGLLRALVLGLGAREQQHALGLVGVGDPHLLAADRPATVDLGGEGGQVQWCRCRRRARSPRTRSAGRPWTRAGEEALLQVLAAVGQDRLEAEDADVHRPQPPMPAPDAAISRSTMAASVTPSPPPPYSSGIVRPEPAALDDRVVELPGELVLLVALHPVAVGEPGAHGPHSLANVLVGLVHGEVHGVLLLAAGPQHD